MYESPKIIAFYLPQFHPTPHNDLWWGKGFTEWSNVRNAKPLFKGHKQPKIPSELGYYDLRENKIREAQAQLAREAGIYGFCYWVYWFGNGQEELELPLNEIVSSGKPNFPYMLGWANESWQKKQWKNGTVTSKEILITQSYPGNDDIAKQFYRYLKSFKDHRYITIEGKPAFLIYKPQDLPIDFINIWNSLAKKEGLQGMFFIAQIISEREQGLSEKDCYKKYTTLGFNAINIVRLSYPFEKQSVTALIRKTFYRLRKKPVILKYSKAMSLFTSPIDSIRNIFPTIIPNWDHSPRSGKGAWILTDSTPEIFKKHVKKVLEKIKNKEKDYRIIFLKSWNEWGEGNYMEPDSEFGKGYITALKSCLTEEQAQYKNE